MGRHLKITNSQTQSIGAYMAEAAGTTKGGLVVVQEIFGVNAHMRHVVDRFAELGYTAIAPAFFDHVEADLELGYDEAGFEKGKRLVGEVGLDLAVDDVAAAAAAIASAGKVGCVGYCWGGTVALLAAIRLGLPAVSYYGARNVAYLDQPLRAPVQFHFGERDSSIPPEAIAEHRRKRPNCDVFTYPAGHAFDREVDAKVYDAPSAALALERTLAFFAEHLSGR